MIKIAPSVVVLFTIIIAFLSVLSICIYVIYCISELERLSLYLRNECIWNITISFSVKIASSVVVLFTITITFLFVFIHIHSHNLLNIWIGEAFILPQKWMHLCRNITISFSVEIILSSYKYLISSFVEVWCAIIVVFFVISICNQKPACLSQRRFFRFTSESPCKNLNFLANLLFCCDCGTEWNYLMIYFNGAVFIVL